MVKFVNFTFCLSWDCSFSTDDDNDTEVEPVDLDTELSLVTECWVEPQSGVVMNCMDQHRHFQGLSYQEIPQAVCITRFYCRLFKSLFGLQSLNIQRSQFTALYVRLFACLFHDDLLCYFRFSQGI